jgi:hypothetical protein
MVGAEGFEPFLVSIKSRVYGHYTHAPTLKVVGALGDDPRPSG